MQCEFESRLSEYVDGALPSEAAALVEAHLADCAGCAALVADLRAIRSTARVLETLSPPPQLWQQIAARIEIEPVPRAAFSFSALSWRMAALAAALVLVIGGGWVASQQATRAPQATTAAVTPAAVTPEAAPVPAAADSVDSQLKLAEENYAKTIAGLDAIRKAEGNALDPDTAEVVQANLTVLDTAIGESRAALQTEPANAIAQDSLFDALQSKVSLLQDAIALINEMRKGNQEGTARIVSGMNQ